MNSITIFISVDTAEKYMTFFSKDFPSEKKVRYFSRVSTEMKIVIVYFSMLYNAQKVPRNFALPQREKLIFVPFGARNFLTGHIDANIEKTLRHERFDHFLKDL